MVISEQTKNFVSAVDEFSSGKIKFRDEIGMIVEHFSVINNAEKFEEMIFRAKYLNGLMKVFSSAAQNPEVRNTDQIEEDFKHNFLLFREMLESAVNSLNDNLKSEMTNKFLGLTPEAMLNTKSLIADLDWVKIYLNEARRGRADQI